MGTTAEYAANMQDPSTTWEDAYFWSPFDYSASKKAVVAAAAFGMQLTCDAQGMDTSYAGGTSLSVKNIASLMGKSL